jgi:multiple sugar transport system substrate-binding protein
MSKSESNPTIQFWDMEWGPAEYGQAGRKLAGQFDQQGGGARVDYRSLAWPEWPGVFTDAVSAGRAPDLSSGGAYQAVEYYDQGEILDLDEVFADLRRTGQDRDFLPRILESQTYRGHSIALPWAIDIRAPYYRKDLFALAGLREPTSWDELRAAARALTSGDRYGMVTCGATLDTMHILFGLMINNGGGLFTTEGRLDVLSDRNVEAMTFFSDLVRDGSFHPGSIGFNAAEARRAFGAGSAAILIDPPGLEVQLPDQAGNIGLMAPLAGPHGDKGTFISVNNLMLYRQSRHPDAARKFLLWWSEHQGSLWTEGRCDQLPVRASIAAAPFFAGRPFVRQLLDQWVPVGRTTAARSPGLFPALNVVEGDGVMMTLCHDLMLGREVLPAMQKANERLKRILE